MPKIDLDQDVIEFIRSHVADFGETPSTLLRRLLAMKTNQLPTAPNLAVSSSSISDSTKSERNQSATRVVLNGTAIQRYLTILSELYQEDPVRFKKVESITAQKQRQGLAKDAVSHEELAEKLVA